MTDNPVSDFAAPSPTVSSPEAHGSAARCPAPVGSYAYHRLARSATGYRWWNPLVVALLGFALYLGFSIIVAIAFIASALAFPDFFVSFTNLFTGGSIDLTDPAVFAFSIGSIALLLPSVLLVRRILGPRPVGLLSSVAGRVRWRWLVRCILPALVVYGAVFSVSFLVGDGAEGSAPPAAAGVSTTWLLIVLAILLTPLQATAEEYVFRGYLAQTIGGWLKHPAWAILLPVPLFAIGHDYDLWGLLDVAIFGAAAGWLTWRTGGLEAAIVAHVVNNTALFVLGAFSLTDLNATAGSAVGALTTLVIMAAYSTIVLWQAKRSSLVTRRIVPPQHSGPRAVGSVVSPTLGE